VVNVQPLHISAILCVVASRFKLVHGHRLLVGRLVSLVFFFIPASLQFAPLVGVPSFVEYSQSLDLHCLFVMVRAVERKSPADSAFEDPIALIPCSRESPMMAFAAAIEDEPCTNISLRNF
jgi:hypothetical protein